MGLGLVDWVLLRERERERERGVVCEFEAACAKNGM